MNYIDITTEAYPLTEKDLRRKFPHVTFPVKFMPPDGFAGVVETAKPAFDPITEIAREYKPSKDANGVWTQQWKVIKLSPAEVQQNKDAAKLEATKVIQAGVQLRLDQFASTRGYDNIVTAVSYATSKNAKYKIEGQYCCDLRDDTWQKVFDILTEVEAGTRTMPSTYDEIESELPVLQWPDTSLTS